jgi:FMN phosphatase YigB (HAD superfamily)
MRRNGVSAALYTSERKSSEKTMRLKTLMNAFPHVLFGNLGEPRNLRGELIETVALVDVDGTLIETAGRDAKFYWPFLLALIERFGFNAELVRLAHQLEKRLIARGILPKTEIIEGVEFLFPEAARISRNRVDPELLLQGQAEYHHLWAANLEIPRFEGVVEGLRELSSIPGMALIAHTLSPYWLACQRLGSLLELLDGVIAVQVVDINASHPYPKNVAFDKAWLRGQDQATEQARRHCVLEAHILPEDCKPQLTAFSVLQKWAGLSPNQIVMIGDNPLTDGQFANDAGSGFVWAAYGDLAQRPTVPFRPIRCFREAPKAVRELLALAAAA